MSADLPPLLQGKLIQAVNARLAALSARERLAESQPGERQQAEEVEALRSQLAAAHAQLAATHGQLAAAHAQLAAQREEVAEAHAQRAAAEARAQVGREQVLCWQSCTLLLCAGKRTLVSRHLWSMQIAGG